MLLGGIGCSNCFSNVVISYDANGGAVSTTSETVRAYSNVTLPTPGRVGTYIFDGWYTDPTEGTKVGGAGDRYKVSGNITIYAQWVLGVHIYYSTNGTVNPSSEIIPVGGIATLPKPTNSGYTFAGWYKSTGEFAGNAGDEYSVEGIYWYGDYIEILYARWIQDISIIYNANGHTVSVPPDSAPAGSNITLPNLPNRNHYTFAGWYSAPIGGERIGAAGETFTIPRDITTFLQFYAQWIPGEVTITYNANGGSVSATSETILADSIIKLPTPTRANYTFLGWYSAPGGGVRIGGAGDDFTIKSTMTLYAQWG